MMKEARGLATRFRIPDQVEHSGHRTRHRKQLPLKDSTVALVRRRGSARFPNVWKRLYATAARPQYQNAAKSRAKRQGEFPERLARSTRHKARFRIGVADGALVADPRAVERGIPRRSAWQVIARLASIPAGMLRPVITRRRDVEQRGRPLRYEWKGRAESLRPQTQPMKETKGESEPDQVYWTGCQSSPV
jgi:hypothetical protein